MHKDKHYDIWEMLYIAQPIEEHLLAAGSVTSSV